MFMYRDARGFTMLELIIAVAIIGVLSSVAMNAYHTYVTKTRLVAAQEEISQALNQYGLDKGVSPATGALDELVKQGYLSELPKDPWSGKADWNYDNDGEWLTFSPQSHPSKGRKLASFGLPSGNGYDSQRARAVQAMRQEQFPSLSSSDIKYLTPEQIAGIQNGYWMFEFMRKHGQDLSRQQLLGALSINPSLLAPNVWLLSKQQMSWVPKQYFSAVKGGWPIATLLNKRPDLLGQMKPSQLASISHPYWVGKVVSGYGAQMTKEQLQSMNPQGVGPAAGALPASKLDWLTPEQFSAISGGGAVVTVLQKRPDLVSSFTPQQIASINHPWWYSQIPANVLRSMTQEQVQAIPAADCAALKSKLSASQQSWCTP